MAEGNRDQELFHEIFGSILDRAELTPFLLLPAVDHVTALRQATRMMANRGFDAPDDAGLGPGERERAAQYVRRARATLLGGIFPFVSRQLDALADLGSANAGRYRSCLDALAAAAATLEDPAFRRLVDEDPRHLFLLASSRRYPRVFSGYPGGSFDVPPAWQQAACTLLKMAHLIKSVEEDSQDINDYVQLGFFLQQEGQRLDDLYDYDWERPPHVPEGEPARRALIKVSAFLRRLRESFAFDPARRCLVFNSGDGVEVDVAAVKARLKSPESMVVKLGKNVEGEAWDIRDILAVTFVLTDVDDTLKLFHALQKRGVILQENTASHSVTQTLFDSPEQMQEAVRRLVVSLARSGGRTAEPRPEELAAHARTFYAALGRNAEQNVHSSRGHRKFQCKIAFSVPIHRDAATNELLLPGTPAHAARDGAAGRTEQQTLGVELRISDVESWRASEHTGDSHHDAYKLRQLVAVLNRVLMGRFHFPVEAMGQLRRDQAALFR